MKLFQLSEILRERRRKKLTHTRPLSYVQAVALMLQIGEGVKYIHSKGMAHRDLKSGNVLVNLDSSSRISSVKIADLGDQGMLEVQDIGPLETGLETGLGPLETAQIQGPWGGNGGGNFFDVGTSINRMKVTYQPRGILGSMEMDYNFTGRNLTRRCSGSVYGDQYEEIVFELDEFIMHISGFESKTPIHVLGSHLDPIDVVSSLTIHTNFRSYGPFGEEKGKPFTSDKGRIIGFHGGSGYVLDSLGVVMIPGHTS